jgi:hypothetical protein
MLSFLFLLLVRCTRKPWVFALGQHKKTVGNGPKLSPRSSGFVATSYPFCAEKVHSFAFYNTKVNQYWQNAERIAEVCKRNSRKYSQSGAHPPRRGGTLKKSKSKGESKGETRSTSRSLRQPGSGAASAAGTARPAREACDAPCNVSRYHLVLVRTTYSIAAPLSSWAGGNKRPRPPFPLLH